MTERVSQADIAGHPDVVALQRQYGQVLGGPQTVASEGCLGLAGAWAAISPWVVGFAATDPALRASNVIIGLIIVAVGLGLTGMAERRGGLSWVAIPFGIWLIISTWIVPATGAGAGMIWSNVLVGAVTVVAGAAATALTGATAPARQ